MDRDAVVVDGGGGELAGGGEIRRYVELRR